MLEQLTVEPADEKLRRQKLNWLGRVTRNEQQQDGKNNAEIQGESLARGPKLLSIKIMLLR